jgi:thymidylate synthase (FAD)
MKKQILDHGYVELIGVMQSNSDDKTCAQSLDEMVVEAARVSYGSGMKGEEKDRKLLHYLLEHEHGTPFEQAVFKFEVKLPIFVMRQWIRHRWGSFNEISGRYTEEVSEEYYVPWEFRTQDTKNKQGSIDKDLGGVYIRTPWENATIDIKSAYRDLCEFQRRFYNTMVKEGVAREQARGILGTAFYTKFVWTVNARSLMNFLVLRCEAHAQWEMRQYANALLEIFKEKMPWTADSMIKLFSSSFVDFKE